MICARVSLAWFAAVIVFLSAGHAPVHAHGVGIESLAIERKSKSEKTKGPDLSTIGSEHDAAWLAKWLRQEVAGEDGKKHSKEWKGTPEQLQQVSDFLAALKKK